MNAKLSGARKCFYVNVFLIMSGLIVFCCVMQGWYLAEKNN